MIMRKTSPPHYSTVPTMMLIPVHTHTPQLWFIYIFCYNSQLNTNDSKGKDSLEYPVVKGGIFVFSMYLVFFSFMY